MFLHAFADLAWSDDAHAPPTNPRADPLTMVRRPAPTRAALPAPRAEGQVLRRWHGGATAAGR